MQPNYSVASFISHTAEGNRHQVFVVNNQVAHLDDFSRYSSHCTDDIVVVVILNTGLLGPPCSLCFYRYGKPIHRCGSGNLAAAHVLFRELKLVGSKQKIVATTRFEHLLLVEEDGRLGYQCHTLALIRGDNRSLWQYIIGRPIVELKRSGARNGYVIAQLESITAVAALRPRLQLLRMCSSDSLIVTASRIGSDSTYVMRYFAPRSGANEDPATGSANALLVQYWWQQGFKRCIEGTQLSDSGGQFYGRIQGRQVALFGKTALIVNHQTEPSTQ